jgi:hypothetical protein
MSYFAIYRGWQQYGAEGQTMKNGPDTLRWDVPANISLSDAADRSVLVAVGQTHRSIAVWHGWLVPILRRAARQA